MLNNIVTDTNDNSNNYMLTTLDNPFNPFSQYKEWYSFDTLKGYNTCTYLSIIAKTSEEQSEIDEEMAIDKAMDEIILLNPLGIYIKVTKESFEKRIKR